MANADILWEIINAAWPSRTTWLTIKQVMALAPQGTAGITNRSTYDFAMLTMLFTVRRNYLIHRNPVTQTAINSEIIKTNRNNSLWRNYLGSRVRKAAGDVIEGCKPAFPVPNNVSPSILPCATNNNFDDPKSRLKQLMKINQNGSERRN